MGPKQKTDAETGNSDKFLEETSVINPIPESIAQEHSLQRNSNTTIKKNNPFPLTAWIKYSTYTVFAVLLMLIFGSGGWAFPDGNNPTCADGSKKNHGVCLMQQVLANGSSSLYMLTGFILGGFLASSTGLWLTRRTAYASLCGATRML